MSALVKVLTGAAGLAAAVGFASPAAAQYYPGYGYGFNNGGGVVGAIVNAVTGNGYGRYGSYGGYGAYGGGNERFAVEQCSRAVQARVGGGYGGYGYNSYGGGVSITGVERKNTGTRVYGVANGGGYGAYGGQLSFSCKVGYNGQLTDLKLGRGSNYGYNGYYRGY